MPLGEGSSGTGWPVAPSVAVLMVFRCDVVSSAKTTGLSGVGKVTNPNHDMPVRCPTLEVFEVVVHHARSLLCTARDGLAFVERSPSRFEAR